jgi:hypothetical protein
MKLKRKKNQKKMKKRTKKKVEKEEGVRSGETGMWIKNE